MKKPLKIKTSYGYDEVSTKILKISSLFISSKVHIVPQFLACKKR
jgi:hypothetical protein